MPPILFIFAFGLCLNNGFSLGSHQLRHVINIDTLASMLECSVQILNDTNYNMKVSAIIKNSFGKNETTVATNSDSKVLIISPKASGYGSSVNGAELLLLSLATCYCNDIYREAAKRCIEVYGVTVDVSGEFGAEGEPGKNFSYKPLIKSNASQKQLEELIAYTDNIAEIHKTIRMGLEIYLQK